ncbi:uncharacterized protein LOC143905637 isoform X2 [Temnothorax americanus]|uniref:uncharacterized protein LOC143905637 isoform X2 n=1 Tax=Temnothorax americanus TaxID=1964332 RepID=UPI0040697430
MKRKTQCLKEGSKNLDTDSVLLNEAILEEKISWLTHKLPSESNKECIKNCLNETFSNRRQWIVHSGPTISNIFEKYPRLLNYRGEMIEQDFIGIYSGCENNFLGKFPSFYTKKILAYATQYKPDIINKTNNFPVNDDDLRALIVLTLLLPPSNSSQKNNGGKSKGSSKKKEQIFLILKKP